MKKQKTKSIFPYFWKYKKTLGLYIIVFAIIAGLGLWGSIETANFLNNLAASDIEKAIYSLIAITAIPFVTQLLYHLAQFMYIRFSAKIALDIKKDLAHRILRVNSASLESTSSGVVINRIDNDPEDLISSLDNFIWQLSDLITYLLTALYVFILNWIVGVAVLAIIIVSAVVEVLRAKVLYKNQKKTKALGEPATSLTSEMIRSQKDIKSLGLEDTFEAKFHEHYQNYKSMSQKTEYVDEVWFRGRKILTELLISGVVFLTLVMLKQEIVALAVVLYVFTNRASINSAVFMFSAITRSWANFKVASERVREVFDEQIFEVEKYGNEEIKNLKGSIEFKNVAFSYTERKEMEINKKSKNKKVKYEYKKHNVFTNLNFKIEENSTVAFVGVSGSGKSTILNLMAKLSDVDSGEVLIGDKNIASLSKNTIRNHMILINQFPYVFDMTIRENILLASPDATEEEILKACKDANLLSYVNKLPDGLDTKIGENGVKMSGGEKQRLAIARALIKNAPIIMFDESTSSLDNVAQAEVTKSIQKLSGNHTVVIVAHRLSSIKDVDKIYFLENGEIIDEGTFNQLNSRNEKFQNIFRAENLEDELVKLKENNKN